jgi:multiple sugar transport system substrate-binding protein
VNRRDFLKKLGRGGAAVAAAPALFQLAQACSFGTSAGPGPQPTPRMGRTGEIRLLQAQSPVAASDVKMRALLDEWADQHSGWSATLDIVGRAEFATRVTAALQSQSGPDLIRVEDNWPWLNRFAYVDVGDLVAGIEKARGRFYDAAAAAVRVDGHWLGVPFACVPKGWTYRVDVWRQVGKPNFVDTHADLYVQGKRLLQQSGPPVGAALSHALDQATATWYPTLWNFGGQEIHKDGKTIAIDSRETEAALNWAIEMWRDKVLSQDAASWNDSSAGPAFSANAVSATLGDPGIYIGVQADDKLAAETGAHPPIAGPKARTAVHRYLSHSVMKWTKDVAAAKDLVQFLMDEANYADWLAAGGGYLSFPGPAFDNHPVWEADPVLKQFNSAVKLGRWPGWPAPPNRPATTAQTSFVIVDMFASAVTSGSVREAIAAAEAQLTKIHLSPP